LEIDIQNIFYDPIMKRLNAMRSLQRNSCFHGLNTFSAIITEENYL